LATSFYNWEDDRSQRMTGVNEAVRLRLRADVPVACYLSGGLDSCAVLGVAAQHASRTLQAFTLSFDEERYDERAIAEEMAAKAGAQFCPIDIRANDLAENLADALVHAERPFFNAHSVAKYLLSRAVRNAGVKVVLTGEGADEVFAGYAHFRRDMLLYNRQGQADEDVQALLDELDRGNQVSQGLLLPDAGSASRPELRRAGSLLGFIPSMFAIWSQTGQAARGLMHRDFRAAYGTRDSIQMLLHQIDVERQLAGREPVHQSLYLWSKTLLNSYILSNLGDRMEMAHSVEGRLPFLDHKLVEAVVQMPVAHKIHGMTEKYVLREAARPVLTETVYRRQKHPFLSPPATLQADGALHELMQDTLRGPTVAQMGVYDQKEVIALLDALPRMNATDLIKADTQLMTILSVCILQEQFGLA
jgi:asparagine synthase (glutamine-hydrolysing)